MAERTPRSTPDFDADESALHELLGKPLPTCPPLDILLAYTEEVLPPAQSNSVRQHLAECRLCPLLLADVATLQEPQLSADQLRRITASLPEKTQRTSLARRYAFIGIAAAVLIAAFTALSLRFRNAPPQSVVVVSQPVSPTMAAIDISISPLAPPQGMLTRGSQSADEPSIDKLMPAFAAYNSADYVTAADRFAQVQAEYPRSEIAALYLGVSQLLAHQDAPAYSTLNSLRHVAPASEDALHWYTAVAAERTHAENAQHLFADICADKSSRWSSQSCHIESQIQSSLHASGSEGQR